MLPWGGRGQKDKKSVPEIKTMTQKNSKGTFTEGKETTDLGKGR